MYGSLYHAASETGGACPGRVALVRPGLPLRLPRPCFALAAHPCRAPGRWTPLRRRPLGCTGCSRCTARSSSSRASPRSGSSPTPRRRSARRTCAGTRGRVATHGAGFGRAPRTGTCTYPFGVGAAGWGRGPPDTASRGGGCWDGRVQGLEGFPPPLRQACSQASAPSWPATRLTTRGSSRRRPCLSGGCC